jgi:hypothetical protein
VELSWAERLLLLQSLLLIPAISILLRVLGFQRSLSVLDRLSRRRCRALPSRSEPVDAKAICRLVGTAARHGLCEATCLRQALVVWFLLRRRGMPAELRIGVRKNAERLDAHAWVESNGGVLDVTRGLAGTDATASPFTVFDSLMAHSG